MLVALMGVIMAYSGEEATQIIVDDQLSDERYVDASEHYLILGPYDGAPTPEFEFREPRDRQNWYTREWDGGGRARKNWKKRRASGKRK